MRLRIYISCVWALLLLAMGTMLPGGGVPVRVPATAAAAAVQGGVVSAHGGYRFNTDGEQGIPQGYSAHKTLQKHHTGRGNGLPPFFASYIPAVKVSAPAAPIMAAVAAVQHFTPLVRLLLFPKHWFW